MNISQIPTPEADDNPGDEIPSVAPSARSASKRSKRTVACGGDTLTPGDKISPQKLASVSHAPAVTADVTESREGGAEPDRPAAQQAAPSHPPGNRRANAPSRAQVDAMPRWLRRQIEQDLPRIAGAYVPLPNAVTSASGAHLEPVGQHELDDDAKIPEFLRRQGVKPSDFVPRALRTAEAVTFPVTQSQATAAPVTPTVTSAPAVGSICPTCHCRVPARLSAAERQRAYRERKRKQGKPVVP